HPVRAPGACAQRAQAAGRQARWPNSSALLRQARVKAKETINRRRHAPPIFGFLGESSPPRSGNQIEFRLTVLLRSAPLGGNPSFLLHAQQSRIKSALVELQHVLAD